MVRLQSLPEKLASLDREIGSLAELHHYLQIAMEIELATIPAYLAALYSLKPGTNEPARDIIRSVVMEEMLHMVLAGNVLLATGGTPKVNDPQYVPDYPTELPASDITDPDGEPFLVGLEKFSTNSIATFMRIEQPEPRDADPEVQGWQSIGQFYNGLKDQLVKLSSALGAEAVFTGRVADQIRPEHYYGAAGEVIIVADPDPHAALGKALEALEEIIEQGEGVDHSVFDGDTLPGRGGTEVPVPAHYFRFQELALGTAYQPGDTPGHPTGDPIDIDWDAVFPMKMNPNMKEHEGTEIWTAMDAFNRVYSDLLDLLQASFSGDQAKLVEAVGVMYQLKYKAEALMKIPDPNNPGETVGPSFEYV